MPKENPIDQRGNSPSGVKPEVHHVTIDGLADSVKKLNENPSAELRQLKLSLKP
jgi:hypothetical protein